MKVKKKIMAVLITSRHLHTIASLPSTPVTHWLSYSPLDPRFTGSNSAGVNEFFQSVGPVS